MAEDERLLAAYRSIQDQLELIQRLERLLHEAATERDRAHQQLDKYALPMLKQCLAVFSHPNFTDRHGMADRIRYAIAKIECDRTPQLTQPTQDVAP